MSFKAHIFVQPGKFVYYLVQIDRGIMAVFDANFRSKTAIGIFGTSMAYWLPPHGQVATF